MKKSLNDFVVNVIKSISKKYLCF